MKLLNPFAGYRYISGHILYHAAFALGSILVVIFGQKELQELPEDASDDEVLANETMEETLFAVNVLRVAHVLVIILQSLAIACDRYTPAKADAIQDIVSSQVLKKQVKPEPMSQEDTSHADATINASKVPINASITGINSQSNQVLPGLNDLQGEHGQTTEPILTDNGQPKDDKEGE